MKYYDRAHKKMIEEKEFRQGALEFLYHTKFGRVLLKAFVSRPIFSKICSLYHKSIFSKRNIVPFVKKYNIKVDSKELKKYRSFNEFFTRRHPYIKHKDKKELVAVADGKLSCYPVSDDLLLHIKNSTYSIDDLVQNKKIASFFKGGTCLVLRLAVTDNHRYHFIDDGKTAFHKKIKGKLHTIRPIAEKYGAFVQNSREVTLLNTKNFGYVAQIEVGALLVGKIKNHKKPVFKKNEEKGYFEFGGSTIVVLLNKDVKIDDDILQMNADGIEVQVTAGEKIGVLLA